MQPQTGWVAPHPIGFTHDQQVANIIKHRLANPAVVAKYHLATDFDMVSKELVKFQQVRGALAPDTLPKLTPPLSSPQMSGAVAQAVAVVRKMASGAAALMEWEEAGMQHVEPEVAEHRASICVACPKNEKGKALTDIFTIPVANMIKKKMERLEGMNLRTSHDQNLATCQACLCPMRTKVWFPEDLILKRLKPDQKQELHESCWILALSKSSSVTSPSARDQLPESTAPAL